ncbi:hypothetical protein HKD37_14G040348 [Glycine soja]
MACRYENERLKEQKIEKISKISGSLKKISLQDYNTTTICKIIAHACQNVLTVAIGRPEHSSHVCAAEAGVRIRLYFGLAITKKVMRQLMLSFSQMQSQGIVPPVEPEIALSNAYVSIKGSCIDPLGQDLDTNTSDKCGLYTDDNPSHLIYEGSTTEHHVLLGNDLVKVGVKEVRDVDDYVLVPTEEVQLVGQAFNTFLAWLTHLVQLFQKRINKYQRDQRSLLIGWNLMTISYTR